MAFWKKLIGVFTGSGSGKIAEIADEAMHTAQERSEADQKDLDSARTMQIPSHSSWFDALVDGLSRLVRPGVTLWLVGGFIGWWGMPKSEDLSDYWQNVFMIVLTFWFGGRAIVKDLPSAIKAMRR